jgi:hypothetical protein
VVWCWSDWQDGLVIWVELFAEVWRGEAGDVALDFFSGWCLRRASSLACDSWQDISRKVEHGKWHEWLDVFLFID